MSTRSNTTPAAEAPEIGEVTWQQAADAIENLDDYARMMVGVDPSGPRETLYRFLEQTKTAQASKAQPKAAEGAPETCAICGEGKALLMRRCSHCDSEYAGVAEMRANAQAPAPAHDEIKRLRALAATCYAGLGAECNLPEIWLDVLNAAANGEPFTTDGLLPFSATALAPEFDVRRIMLDVVPGADGMGEEVYAKSVADVEAVLTRMGERIEELESCAPAPAVQAEPREVQHTIKQAGAVACNGAATRYESPSCIVLEMDLRSKYCALAASCGHGVFLCATERSLHLDDSRPRDDMTWVEFELPAGKWSFVSGSVSRYTLTCVFLRDADSNVPVQHMEGQP